MDLRAEMPDVPEARREALLAALASDWTRADLGAVDRALCTYAVKLTRTPQAMTESDVQALRGAGLDDVAIHDAIQVVGYFNYINRVADGVRVELEPEMDPYPDGER